MQQVLEQNSNTAIIIINVIQHVISITCLMYLETWETDIDFCDFCMSRMHLLQCFMYTGFALWCLSSIRVLSGINY